VRVLPRAPLDGEVEAGAGPMSMVRQFEHVPADAPGFVTETLRGPIVAPDATLTCAVIFVVPVNATDVTDTPLPDTDTVAPLTKFEPLIVSYAFLAPCPSALGVTEVTVAGDDAAGRCKHECVLLSYSRWRK